MIEITSSILKQKKVIQRKSTRSMVNIWAFNFVNRLPYQKGVLNEFNEKFKVQKRALERLEKIRSSSEVLKHRF